MGQLSGSNDSDKIPSDAMTDATPMTLDRHDKVVTEHAAYTADVAVYSQAKRSDYIDTSTVDDAIEYARTANTNASGVATFYLTSDRTVSGSALYTTVYSTTVSAMPYGGSNNYQVTSYTVSPDLKTVTVSVNQMAGAILGFVNVTSAAAGIPVNLKLKGK